MRQEINVIPSSPIPSPAAFVLSIIIVNWNGGQLLLNCLQSIRASRASFPVKVIVVDNNSSDGSREAAQATFPEYHIFNSGANLGFGRANNLARPLVETPLVLFLNPDTELKENTLEIAVKNLLDRSDVGALGCKMRYPDGPIQDQGLQWFPSPWTILLEMLFVSRGTRRFLRPFLPSLDLEKSNCVRKLNGGFILARKNVLDQAGWFDERYFMYAEDVDLSFTIERLGWKLFYCAEADIVHVAGGASAKAPNGFSVMTKNESINSLIRKYRGARGAILHRGVVFLGALFRLVCLIPARLFRIGAVRSDALAKWKWMLRWSLGYKALAKKP